ncbi:MAG: serine hydrolase domain-containing protein [Pseudomonadota bacterium]
MLTTLLALTLTATLPAAAPPEVAAAVPRLLQSHEVPAVAIAVVEDGELAWTAVFGERRPGDPADDGTLFNVASMTKPVVAELALRMAARGDFGLDDPMAAHWVDPDIAGDPRHLELTPRLALQHRTGLPNWRRETEGKLALRFDPGTRAGYSGEGFDYLGRFLEQRSGEPLTALAGTTLLAPLGMSDTRFVFEPALEDRLAWPSRPGGESREPVRRDDWSAADDLLTTPADYGRFLASVLSGEGLTDDLRAQRWQLPENQFAGGCPWGPDECPRAGGFALGWAVFEYEAETVVSQGGADWGERALGLIVPERQLAVAIFTNSSNGMKVIAGLLPLLYDNPDFQAFVEFQAR